MNSGSDESQIQNSINEKRQHAGDKQGIQDICIQDIQNIYNQCVQHIQYIAGIGIPYFYTQDNQNIHIEGIQDICIQDTESQSTYNKVILRYPDRTIMYEGYWVNDQMHGTGEFFYQNGEAYKGWFMYNLPKIPNSTNNKAKSDNKNNQTIHVYNENMKNNIGYVYYTQHDKKSNQDVKIIDNIPNYTDPTTEDDELELLKLTKQCQASKLEITLHAHGNKQSNEMNCGVNSIIAILENLNPQITKLKIRFTFCKGGGFDGMFDESNPEYNQNIEKITNAMKRNPQLTSIHIQYADSENNVTSIINGGGKDKQGNCSKSKIVQAVLGKGFQKLKRLSISKQLIQGGEQQQQDQSIYSNKQQYKVEHEQQPEFLFHFSQQEQKKHDGKNDTQIGLQ